MKWHVFIQLMRKDLVQFRRVYRGRFFDTCLLLFTNMAVFGYFMPDFGISSSYAAYLLLGAIASFGLFDTTNQVGDLLSDLDGDQTIQFTLAMPAPYWVIFGQLSAKWVVQNVLLCVPLFLVGKLILWNQFDLKTIHWPQMTLIFITASCFFGVFGLWMTAVIQRIKSLSTLYLRFIVPLFMFGAYFFTWKSTFGISPILSYALLINPMVYVMEGMHAAGLGQAGFLPLWTCCLALWGFILVLGIHAIRTLKKRLDCV